MKHSGFGSINSNEALSNANLRNEALIIEIPLAKKARINGVSCSYVLLDSDGGSVPFIARLIICAEEFAANTYIDPIQFSAEFSTTVLTPFQPIADVFGRKVMWEVFINSEGAYHFSFSDLGLPQQSDSNVISVVATLAHDNSQVSGWGDGLGVTRTLSVWGDYV